MTLQHAPEGDVETLVSRWDKGRVEAFSDGVMAIAITLLVLEIHIPTNLVHIQRELAHEWPSYLAYVTSFLTIGGVWVDHHRLFRRLRAVDSNLVRLNLLLLMVLSFVPFPTGILAEALRAPDTSAETAVELYGATVLILEIVLHGLVWYAASRRELWGAPEPHRQSALRHVPGRAWFSLTIMLYLVAMGLALLGLQKLAVAAYLVLAVRGVVLIERPHRRARSPVAT